MVRVIIVKCAFGQGMVWVGTLDGDGGRKERRSPEGGALNGGRCVRSSVLVQGRGGHGVGFGWPPMSTILFSSQGGVQSSDKLTESILVFMDPNQ